MNSNKSKKVFQIKNKEIWGGQRDETLIRTDVLGVCPHCGASLIEKYHERYCGYCGGELRWK